MMPTATSSETLHAFDGATRALVRLSAAITSGDDLRVRDALATASTEVPAPWIEELLLQSYLFAGFPRALNATREWRRIQPNPVPFESSGSLEEWRADGQATCAAVYGSMYERLRENIRGLHPLLDEWMISEGYGKVLSRSALDLARRELCIIAACAAAGQDRQLHSHFHGALNVGVAPSVIDQTLHALTDLVGAERAQSIHMLWARVQGK